MAGSPLFSGSGCCTSTSTKLVIVISAGVSLLQPTIIHNRHAYLALTNQLDGSNFVPAAIDCRPFLSHYAAVGCHKDYKDAIIERHIYRAPNLSGYPDDAKLEGVVDAFHADLSCQVLMNSTKLPKVPLHIVRHVQANSLWHAILVLLTVIMTTRSIDAKRTFPRNPCIGAVIIFWKAVQSYWETV
ncbi:hypothetical protein BDV27DRAFT_153225 [Aspergillus caelatus]|uniref:Uncharacterized protein n=1 Tax=Aspergillus caelatus TaxID=61420 RepID=A0A5N7AKW4_9EURO|nr:uncharacterized protein BDV27DRAFT_153225 [Aspergillus caelatus]KAE8369350.1 hypothetical protein BDV27DRAFT_153225 [Aspergillus caelatus]